MKQEARNQGVESRPVIPGEVVRPFHVSRGTLEPAPTAVFVHVAGLKVRLFADDTFPFDLGVFADGIVNVPMASEQLRRCRSDVLDADEIGKDVAVLARV